MSVEQRDKARQRVFLKGRITFSNGASSMDCVVRDFSPTGARLLFSEAVALPQVFDLCVPHKGRTFRAALSWRHGEDMGVTFAQDDVHAQSPTSTATEPTSVDAARALLRQRLSELEAENAALRQAVVDRTAH